MRFSILLWNVWHVNQIESQNKLNQLLQELKRLSNQYEPDCIALCEVVQPSQDKTPPIVEYLQELGYKHSHYAKMAHIGEYWMSGVALSSRIKLSDKQRHVISKNGSASRHGYPELDKEIISAAIAVPEGPDIRIIVAHPSAAADSLKQNRVGIKNLTKLISSEPFTKNTLLLGDMNQWRFMPGSFRSKVKDAMHVRTGSTFNPTWRHGARRLTPFRLNLDYVYWSKASDFRLKEFKVLSSDVSDHRPILATFEYPAEKR